MISDTILYILIGSTIISVGIGYILYRLYPWNSLSKQMKYSLVGLFLFLCLLAIYFLRTELYSSMKNEQINTGNDTSNQEWLLREPKKITSMLNENSISNYPMKTYKSFSPFSTCGLQTIPEDEEEEEYSKSEQNIETDGTDEEEDTMITYFRQKNHPVYSIEIVPSNHDEKSTQSTIIDIGSSSSLPIVQQINENDQEEEDDDNSTLTEICIQEDIE